MKKFEAAIQILENVLSSEPTETELDAEKLIKIKEEIARTNEYLTRLENLTKKAEFQGYDTSTINQKITEIKKYLENATRALNEREIDLAKEDLDAAKILISKVVNAINLITDQIKTVNIQKYIMEAEIRISDSKTSITLSTSLFFNFASFIACLIGGLSLSKTSSMSSSIFARVKL